MCLYHSAIAVCEYMARLCCEFVSSGGSIFVCVMCYVRGAMFELFCDQRIVLTLTLFSSTFEEITENATALVILSNSKNDIDAEIP